MGLYPQSLQSSLKTSHIFGVEAIGRRTLAIILPDVLRMLDFTEQRLDSEIRLVALREVYHDISRIR